MPGIYKAFFAVKKCLAFFRHLVGIFNGGCENQPLAPPRPLPSGICRAYAYSRAPTLMGLRGVGRHPGIYQAFNWAANGLFLPFLVLGHIPRICLDGANTPRLTHCTHFGIQAYARHLIWL